MVRTVGQAPDWASTLDRPVYLQLLAAVQRWLAANGPGMVRGDEIRLVQPRRVIALAPIVEMVRDAPDLYVATAAALDAALAAGSDQPAAAPTTQFAPAIVEPRSAVDTDPPPVAPVEVRDSAVPTASFAAIAPRLSLRLAPAESIDDRLALDVGVPDIQAVLVETRENDVRDVTVLEATTWPARHDELLDMAIARLEQVGPDSVRVVQLAGIGEVVAIEGESVTTAAHALWVERCAGPSAQGWVVGIPDDHLVFVRSLAEPATAHQIGALAALVREEYERGLGPISPELFWFGPDRVEVLVHDASTGTVEVPARSSARAAR